MELPVTHRTTVTEDQIDHLGHMNVRYYAVAARAASAAAVGGLGPSEGVDIEPVEVYTRHLREQLLGADLEVRTGVLGSRAGSVRLYHELANAASGELAATFVHRIEARGPEGPRSDWSPTLGAPVVDLPERGKPRSIDLATDLQASSPDLATVRGRDLAMRRPRAVTAEECGPDGWVRIADAPMLIWGGVPMNGATGPDLHPGPNGELIGWASMETRMALRRSPRAGDQIQSFGATIALADKIMHQVMWAFDVDRGDLLCAFEVVSLAFDTITRKAVSIPPDLRAHADRQLHLDLRPA